MYRHFSGKSGKSQSQDRLALAKTAIAHLSEMCSNLDAVRVIFPVAEADLSSLRYHCPDPASEEIVPVGRRYDKTFDKILTAFVEDMLRGMQDPINVRNVSFGTTEAFEIFKKYTTRDGITADHEMYIAGNYLMEINKVFKSINLSW